MPADRPSRRAVGSFLRINWRRRNSRWRRLCVVRSAAERESRWCVVIGSGGEAATAAPEVMRSDEEAAAGYREWLAAAQRAGRRVLQEPDGT